MNCPQCQNKADVIDTRTNKGGSVKRRRRCQSCHFRFSTIEVLANAGVVEPAPKIKEPKPKVAKAVPAKAPVVKEKKERKKEAWDDLTSVWNRGASEDDIRELGIDISLDTDW